MTLSSTVPDPQAATVSARGTISPEALERFVYLVGSPRSGTTVITRSFYLSDRVFECPNPTRFTQQVWKHRNKVDARLLMQIFKMPKFMQERGLLKGMEREARAPIARKMHDAFETKHLGRMYQLYPLLHSLDQACAKRPERALCWADKGNDVYGLFAIARYLPQAKFILIVRDPRPTVASMTRQIARSRERIGLDSANLASLVASCLYWRNMMQSFLRLDARYPGRAMFLRYEDFVRKPEETINRALEFATGERMPAEALRAAISRFPHSKKHDRSAVGFGIDHRPLERWRRMLSDEQIKVATALTWRTARKLGYEIERPRSRLVVLRALAGLKGWRKRATLAAKLVYLELMERLTPARGAANARDSSSTRLSVI
jgi:hypothetical protein